MHIAEIPFLVDQWYAVARSTDLPDGAVHRVELLGSSYVLWRPPGKAPVLTQAYCPHRGAHLSAGTVVGESLRCCYHGWEFDACGSCTRIPQLESGVPVPPKAHLEVWPTVERYGAVWACVGEPATDGPPPWHEADVLGWRVQVDFLEPWECSALRIMDNNLDQAHPAFVHQATFGDPSRPLVPRYDLEHTPSGFRARVVHAVSGVGPQMGIADEDLSFERVTEVELLSPVHTRILLAYSGRAPDYCFYGSATPLDDDRSLYVRISALAAEEDVQPYEMFHAYSRRVTLEDKVVLETTHGDFPLEVTSEVHLRCDKTTLEYRRYLAGLLPAQPTASRSSGSSGSGVPARTRPAKPASGAIVVTA